MKKLTTKQMGQAAIIAALYFVLTVVPAMFGFPVRISEMLCILPIFTPAAIPGLFVGCLLSNMLSAAGIFDIVIGSLATLLAAIGTRALRNTPIFAIDIPVVVNMIAIPFVIILSTGAPMNTYLMYMAGVFISEAIACGLLGTLLYYILKKRWKDIDK